MIAATRKLTARLRTALRRAAHITRAARYASLNGSLATELAEGRLIQASTYLRTLGIEDAGIASFRSWYGRKVKAAYRAAHGNLDPQRAWVMIDGHWTSVHVYTPSDPALAAGKTALANGQTVYDTAALMGALFAQHIETNVLAAWEAEAGRTPADVAAALRAAHQLAA